MIQCAGNILLIDDDPLLLMNLADLIEDEGYNPVAVNSVAQALSAVSNGDFDLIICDHDLPDGKGLTVLRRLAARNSQTPVLYLSAALPDILNEAGKFEFVKKIVSKPVANDDFLAQIKSFIDIRSADDGQYPRLIGGRERRMLLDDLEI